MALDLNGKSIVIAGGTGSFGITLPSPVLYLKCGRILIGRSFTR
jgi:FlaA1/EpsC-like NDP-sugar epimerase